MTNIFDDFTIAIAYPSKYLEFLKKKDTAVALFVAILMLVTSLATVLQPMIIVGRTMNEFYTYDVPYFKVENGEMTTEKEFEIKDGMMYIGISNDREYTKEDVKDYNVALLFDKDSFVVKSYNQLNSAKFSDFGEDISFDKDFIYNFKGLFILIIIMVSVMMILFNVAGFFIGAFVLKWITKGYLRAMKVEITSKEHYRLCIYSRTTPVLLSALLGLFNIALPYIIGILISMFYLRAAFFKLSGAGIVNIDNNSSEKENEDEENDLK